MASKKNTTKDKKDVEAKDKTVAAETASAPADAKAEAPKKDKARTSVDIIAHGNIYIRTYSLDIHGEDFEDLVAEFLGKHPKATAVDSESIQSVIVKYREKEDAEKPLDKQNPDLPFVDKERIFEDKEEALAFNIAKKGTIVVKRVK